MVVMRGELWCVLNSSIYLQREMHSNQSTHVTHMNGIWDIVIYITSSDC